MRKVGRASLQLWKSPRAMSDGESHHEDSNFVAELRRAIRDKYVNAAGTFVIITAGLYLATVAAFNRSVVHPLTPSEHLPTIDDVGHTVVSLLILLLSSLALGWVFSIIKLPALLGGLLMGVAFGNIPLLSETFSVDPQWESIIRLLALACIIIRWGVGLNSDELLKRPILPFSLGIISPFIESAIIALAGHFIFNMHLSIAIICGLLLAAVSPAVTVPVMLDLKKKGHGTDSGVPTSVLAASSIDNLFCMGAFSTAVSLTFTEEPASLAVMWSIFQIIIGVIGGFVLGWLFWWFPLPSDNPAPRILLLGSAAAGAVLGLTVVGWATTGIIAAIIFCSLPATRWRKENNSSVKLLEQSFSTVWNLVCLPLLFALIGRKLVFSELTASDVWISLALIGIGAFGRLASAFCLSMCSVRPPEALFIAISMLPKATVQAALGPGLLAFATQFSILTDDLRQTMTACVLTILITAPLGELLLFVLGGVLLDREERGSSIFGGRVHQIRVHSPTYIYEAPPIKPAEDKPPPPPAFPPPSERSNPFTRQMFVSRNEDNMQFRM